MLVSHLKVLVKHSVYTTTRMTVMPQELAMLMIINGEPNVEVLGPDDDIKPREVDPGEEYARLGNKYKNDKDGRPWVEIVFGQPHENRMTETIKGGMAKFFPPKKKRKSRAKKPTAVTS